MSLDTARRVLRIEAQAIQDVLRRLDATFEKAVDVLFEAKNLPLVDANALENAVAVQQAMVIDADPGVRLVEQLAVDVNLGCHPGVP